MNKKKTTNVANYIYISVATKDKIITSNKNTATIFVNVLFIYIHLKINYIIIKDFLVIKFIYINIIY